MVSPAVLELLRKAARGRDLDEFLISLVAERLDPADRAEAYVKLYEKYLKEAESLYAKGDLPQAGEKYWGAATALLNAIAEKKGLPHYSHRDYAEVVEVLYEETGDKELVVGFSLAERLHANFYHNFMRRESFELHREAVLKLVEKLRRML